MATAERYDKTGTALGSIELDEHYFAAPINVPVMHQVVTAQLAAARAGTSKVKSRSEVRGGGRKPWRQKGTGRARQGSIRAPQWTGGGVAHGPTGIETYGKRASKKLKKLALRSALSDRASSGDIRVLVDLSFDEPKTKEAVGLLEAMDLSQRRVLLVLASIDRGVALSFRNLTGVHMLTVDQINTYDVLASDVVLFQEEALAYLGTGTRADLPAREQSEEVAS